MVNRSRSHISRHLRPPDELSKLLRKTELLPAIHISPDAPFSGLLNVTEALNDLITLPLGQRWAPAERWSAWQKQVLALLRQLKEHPDLYEPRAPSQYAGNPFGGDFLKYPQAALLCQPVERAGLQPLARLLKSAALYHWARRAGGITPQLATSLRRALAGGECSGVLDELASAFKRHSAEYVPWIGRRMLALPFGNDIPNPERRFRQHLYDLLAIEIETGQARSTRRIYADLADPDDTLQPRVDFFDNGPNGDPSISEEPPPNRLLAQPPIDGDDDLAEEHELSSETEARARQSRNWIAAVERHNPYAWGALNPLERRYLVATLQRSISTDIAEHDQRVGATALLLSYVSGRPIDDVVTWKIDDSADVTLTGHYRRTYFPPENAYKPQPEIEDYLHPMANVLLVQLPPLALAALDSFSGRAGGPMPLHQAFGRSPTKIKTISHDLLARWRSETGYRLSPHRVRAALRQQLADDGVNKLAIYLLTGAANEEPPIEAYYVALSSAQLDGYYRMAVDALLLR
jgi:hypothetical protein